jgi:hypothetical protein
MTTAYKSLGNSNEVTLTEFVENIWDRLRDNSSVQFSLPANKGGELNFVIAYVGWTPKPSFQEPPLNFKPPTDKSQVN